jgi:hypothetical protein
VEESQVRLYNNGQEIATNIAPRRVALDRDEAFEYMLIDHLSRHKGATLEATPAMGRLNEGTKSRLNIEQLKHVYFVKVSPEGRAVAAFRDPACSQPVDDTVADVIGNVRFYPALDKGKATEGVARLAFHQLAI